MPELDGFEVLERIRKRPELRGSIVIMFTTSDLPVDIEKARQLGASAYRVKPLQLAELTAFVRELHECWSQGKTPSFWPEPAA